MKYRWDDDGSLILNASLPAEIGALVLKALDAAIEESPTPQQSATVNAADFVPRDHPIDRPGRSIQRADALGVLAESFMAHGAEAMSGGDRHQVVVRVSAETLMGNGNANAIGCCEVEHGPAVPAETARRLSCDASLVFLTESEKGEPLNIGRKTRTIPSALRRALNARDRGCRFPGCTHTRYVDHHHIRHWAHGGETKPSNLVSLCRFHHRKVHEGAVRVQILDDGALRFLRPDGVSLDSVAPGHTEPLGNWQQLPAVHHARGIHINKRTNVPLTPGDRMDYGGAVISLLRIAKTGRASLPRLPDH